MPPLVLTVTLAAPRDPPVRVTSTIGGAARLPDRERRAAELHRAGMRPRSRGAARGRSRRRRLLELVARGVGSARGPAAPARVRRVPDRRPTPPDSRPRSSIGLGVHADVHREQLAARRATGAGSSPRSVPGRDRGARRLPSAPVPVHVAVDVNSRPSQNGRARAARSVATPTNQACCGLPRRRRRRRRRTDARRADVQARTLVLHDRSDRRTRSGPTTGHSDASADRSRPPSPVDASIVTATTLSPGAFCRPGIRPGA